MHSSRFTRAAGVLALCAAALSMQHAGAEVPVVAPPDALLLDNVPPIPASVATEVSRYTAFRPTAFSAWHPTRLEMILARRHKNTSQLHRLSTPGGEKQLLTDYPEPVRAASYQPTHGKYYVFSKDTGGNEVYRAFRRDLAGGEAVPITPDGQRVQGLAWSSNGRQVAYVTVPVNRQGSADTINSTLSIADPIHPENARKLAELPGGGWGDFSFSPDNRKLLYLEYVSANESHLWLMDIASGRTRRITQQHVSGTVAHAEPRFSRDGKGIYAVSDQGSEFRRLIYIDLATLERTVLTPDIAWDVENVELSDDGKMIAFVVNEDGRSSLQLMPTASHRLVAAPALPAGTISGISWHKNSRHLGLSLTSAGSPSEAYSIDTRTRRATRWTTHEPTAVDASTFVEPELVRWQSFDARMISGFIYRPPGVRFPGKRPVLINIHGGPEGQFQPGFQGRNNYFINEMGLALIYPNVRGSSGYGKSFLKLDNGRLREDSVRDIGALLDWIAAQPDLDASRVAVTGGSYGGYMSLAVATMYPDRIAASIDVVGISSFVTFLEKTESYRRDLRRVEYGDERDPEMRRFMESIAPLNNADRIKKPLFVVQGKNDPRVPYQEADQIVATVRKNGIPVWYMTANDEGHGFAKKVNADYQFYTTIEFLGTYLVPQ